MSWESIRYGPSVVWKMLETVHSHPAHLRGWNPSWLEQIALPLPGLWSGLQRWQPWVWVQRLSAGAVYVERLKGLYRSTSAHAFCMRETLSKRRLRLKKKKLVEGELLKICWTLWKILMLKCYACKLAFIYWIVHELSSTWDITRFSFLPLLNTPPRRLLLWL